MPRNKQRSSSSASKASMLDVGRRGIAAFIGGVVAVIEASLNFLLVVPFGFPDAFFQVSPGSAVLGRF